MERSISSLGTQRTQTERPRSVIESFYPNDRPKLLFMGPRSGGKSSIREVVFHKLQPDQTLHIETTRKITQDDIKSFIDFEIWDLPGPLELDMVGLPFTQVGAVIFVIDAQSSYLSTIPQLALALTQAYESNPSLHFEIFMHKIDAVTPDYRNEIIEQFKDRLSDELTDRELSSYSSSSISIELEQRIIYKLTTVFDYSIYDALSRTIMKIIPQQAALENLMNLLAVQSEVENCILFDTWTKLYVAINSLPIEKIVLEMCTEFMDIFTDLSELYGVPQQISPVKRPNSMLVSNNTNTNTANSNSSNLQQQQRSDSLKKSQRSPSRGRTRELSPSTRLKNNLNSSTSSSVGGGGGGGGSGSNIKDDNGIDRGRRMITSHVKLDPSFGGDQMIDQAGKVISYYEINQFLTLVCITNEEIMRNQGTLIEYNVSRVRESIRKIFEINKK